MKTLQITAGRYNSLPDISGKIPKVGSVLWVCNRDQTPDQLNQAPDELSNASKYVALGSVMVGDSERAKAAMCLDMFAAQAADIDWDGLDHSEVAVVALRSPETLDPDVREIRLGSGLWSVESIRGAMYQLSRNPTAVDPTIAEILDNQELQNNLKEIDQ